MLWDVFKVPHHCSYTAIGPEKGVDETKPTDEVKWLCETQGRERHIDDVHQQVDPDQGQRRGQGCAAAASASGRLLQEVANAKDGQFKVTMDLPSASKPKPTKIEITDRGARLLTVSATVGRGSIVSTPARAG